MAWQHTGGSTAAEQGLATAGQAHDACGQGLCQAVNFQRLGAVANVLVAVGPQAQGTAMDAGACKHRRVHAGQGLMNCLGASHAVLDTVEQDQKSVALVDFAAPPLAKQVAGDVVVTRPEFSACLVAQTFR